MDIARLYGYRPWQQEKHYIQSLILNAMAGFPAVFKGGTYLWFFHGLQRFSEDLDFTVSDGLPAKIIEVVSASLDLMGVANTVKVISDDGMGSSFRVMANGPLHTGDKNRCAVYVEMSKREQVLRDRIPVRLERPEYQLPIKHLLGMGLDEVAAEKARAILVRDKARDVYDLHYLITRKSVPFDAGLVNKKLEIYGATFSKATFMKAVGKKRQLYSKELESMVFDDLPGFKGVMASISKWAT